VIRQLARLRTENPLLGSALLFIVGQVLQSFFYLSALALFAALCGLWFILPLVARYVSRRGRRFKVSEMLLRSGVLSILILGALSLELQRAPDWPAEQKSSEVVLLGKVAESPRCRKVGQVELALFAHELKFLGQKKVEAQKLSPPLKIRCRAVYLPWRNILNAEAGDHYVLRVQLNRISKFAKGYEASLYRQGFRAQCRIRQAVAIRNSSAITMQSRIVQKLEQTLGEGERSGMLLALVLGVRDKLSDETEQSFKKTGLAHALVFSGYQVSICFLMLSLVLRELFLRITALKRVAYLRELIILASFLGLALFLQVANAEFSVYRAALSAFTLVILALSERGRGGLHSLTLVLLVLHVFWPACILDPGVQLTFAALGGIMLGSEWAGGKGWRAGLASCICAGFATSLVSMYWFSEASWIGIPLNIVGAPLLTFLSCNVGVLGYILSEVFGIDLLLWWVSSALLRTRDALMYLAASDIGLVSIASVSGVLYASLALVLLTAFFLSQWSRAKKRNNFFSVPRNANF
jgi:ComEC/Rec2-related protein